MSGSTALLGEISAILASKTLSPRQLELRLAQKASGNLGWSDKELKTYLKSLQSESSVCGHVFQDVSYYETVRLKLYGNNA